MSSFLDTLRSSSASFFDNLLVGDTTKDGNPRYPPTYFGPPQEVLPVLPTTLTELRLGQWKWSDSVYDKHGRWALFGMATAALARSFQGRSPLPFRRGLRHWNGIWVWMGVGLGISFVAVRLEKTYEEQNGMRLELLRRMRARDIEKVRFEAQRVLEGLPEGYDLSKMERVARP